MPQSLLTPGPRSVVIQALALGLTAGLAPCPRAWAMPRCGRAPGPMLVLTSLDNGRSLEICPGSQIQLILAENPSTGYRWSLARLDPARVRLVSEQSQGPGRGASSLGQPQPVGSPATVVYRFMVMQPGRTAISLRQLRSWEGDRSTIDRFRVNLHIQAPSTSRRVPNSSTSNRP